MSFVHFAAAHGLLLDRPVGDGRWRRTRTEDKPRKKNGSYLWDALRGIGVVRNWATMDECAVYRDESVKVDEAVMRQIRERVRRQQEQEDRRRNRAADVAAEMVRGATLVVPEPGTTGRWRSKPAVLAHPYLIRKGLPNAAALVRQGQILVPMYLGKRLVNVQRIDEDGSKKFLFGGISKGACYRIGPNRPRQAWLVEGYATGLTVKAALERMKSDAAVIVCFSAENLKECPGTHVFADNDHPNKINGRKAGEEAAIATGLPWVMPPDAGMDANDLMARDGLGAVVNLIQEVYRR